MKRSVLVAALLAVSSCAPANRPEPPSASVAVRVLNESEVVRCAEKDNVSLLLQDSGVRRFTIETTHPAYIGSLRRDNIQSDFNDCDMSADPAVPAEPKRVVLYESAALKVAAYTYATFWRKNRVPFRVGNRVEEGLHLVQLWVTHAGKSHELMVVYPPDGYWRAHPLPPASLGWSSYGSSFLVGPIETAAGRPVVNFESLAFDPDKRQFHLNYVDGSSGTLTVRTADVERTVLDVDLGRPVTKARGFAALRSMYVADENADVARVALTDPRSRARLEGNVVAFPGGNATEIWTGRVVPSRHNTSAPDVTFRAFQR